MSEFQQYSQDALRTAGEDDLLEMTKLVKEFEDSISSDPTLLYRYQNLVHRMRVASDHDSYKVGIMYDCLGVTGEAGELADYVKKCVGHGKQFDTDVAQKEAGDVLWYINRLVVRIGKSLQETADKNIAKLKARYPDGFSHQASENRTN